MINSRTSVMSQSYQNAERSARNQEALEKTGKKDVYCNFPVEISNLIFEKFGHQKYNTTAYKIYRNYYFDLNLSEERNDDDLKIKQFLLSVIDMKGKIADIEWDKEEFDSIRMFFNDGWTVLDMTLKGFINRIEKWLENEKKLFKDYPNSFSKERQKEKLRQYNKTLKIVRSKLK